MRRWLEIGLFGILILAGLMTHAAMRAAAAEPTLLQALISGNQEYIDNVRAVFDAFEQANPDIKIELLQTDDVGPKFRVMYAGGTAPDLLRMRGTEPADFGTAGMIEDLTPLIRRDGLPLDDFIPPAIPSLGWGGRIYAIPLGVTIEALLYNKGLFDQAGIPYPTAAWSWEREAVTHGRKLTIDQNGDGVFEQFFLGGLGILEAFPFIYAAGGELFSEDGAHFLANSPAAAAGLQFAGDLKNVFHVAPNTADEAAGSWEFRAGNIAANITGSWYIGTLRRVQTDFAWDAANVPTFRGTRSTNLWPETPWGIASTSKHKEEAWRVLKFIASEEGQGIIARLGLATPIRLSVARGPAYVGQSPPEHIRAFIEAALAPRTRALPVIPGWSNVYPVLDSAVIRPVYNGETAASLALAAAEARIQAILDQAQRGLGR